MISMMLILDATGYSAETRLLVEGETMDELLGDIRRLAVKYRADCSEDTRHDVLLNLDRAGMDRRRRVSIVGLDSGKTEEVGWLRVGIL